MVLQELGFAHPDYKAEQESRRDRSATVVTRICISIKVERPYGTLQFVYDDNNSWWMDIRASHSSRFRLVECSVSIPMKLTFRCMWSLECRGVVWQHTWAQHTVQRSCAGHNILFTPKHQLMPVSDHNRNMYRHN